jgi:hypothetical protein
VGSFLFVPACLVDVDAGRGERQRAEKVPAARRRRRSSASFLPHYEAFVPVPPIRPPLNRRARSHCRTAMVAALVEALVEMEAAMNPGDLGCVPWPDLRSEREHRPCVCLARGSFPVTGHRTELVLLLNSQSRSEDPVLAGVRCWGALVLWVPRSCSSFSSTPGDTARPQDSASSGHAILGGMPRRRTGRVG